MPTSILKALADLGWWGISSLAKDIHAKRLLRDTAKQKLSAGSELANEEAQIIASKPLGFGRTLIAFLFLWPLAAPLGPVFGIDSLQTAGDHAVKTLTELVGKAQYIHLFMGVALGVFGIAFRRA